PRARPPAKPHDAQRLPYATPTGHPYARRAAHAGARQRRAAEPQQSPIEFPTP
ncbi:hypothetical protein I5K77_32610, partial [Pseudomonas aeruginosa]|nr:hypothetical protein [Pseudomonas aeruginosa]